MKDKKKTEKDQLKPKTQELKPEDLEKASGGGDNPFKDVPRVVNHDYDSEIRKKV